MKKAEFEKILLAKIKQDGGVKKCYETYGETPHTRNTLYYQLETNNDNIYYATNLSDGFLKDAGIKESEGVK
ncbi:hypothetical protein SDC9_80124 [bioreactor metagenome]|uniref:Uncharacterized protein n=1 Tax=bioreactor metagenome TaxID=1076179 RepID=A0A644YZS9_9ZZZZ